MRFLPRGGMRGWLLGDWGRWIRDPIDVLRLALLVGAFITLAIGPREQSFRLLLSFLLVLIPRAIDAPRPFDLGFVLAMSLQAWGNVFGAFDSVYAYDKVVHTILSGASAALAYLALIRLEVVPDLAKDNAGRHRLGMVLVATAFGWALWGGMYELYEWFADHALGANLYVGYGDSIGDLTVDGFGALGGALLILLWDSRGWGTRRRARPTPSDGEDPVSSVGEELLERLPEPTPPHPVENPPRLAGLSQRDWPGPLLGPLDLLRLSFLVGVVVAIVDGNFDAATRFGLSFAAVLAVRQLRPPLLFDLAFLVAMAFQAWGAFATQMNAYSPYEGLTHVLVSAAATPVLYVALIRLELVPSLAFRRVHERGALALIGFSFGFSAGILYELYRYLADHLLGASFTPGYDVLIGQLSLDAAGALIGAALLVVWDIRGWAVTGDGGVRD